MYLPAPFEPSVHYVESEVDQMAETVQGYLADEEARRRITDTAYTFLTEGHTFKRVFAWLLDLADHAVAETRPTPD